MLKADHINEIHRLAQAEHWSMRRIPRHLHLAARTVKKYLWAPAPLPTHRSRSSKLDSFKPLIADLLEQDPRAPGAVILERLRKAGYRGGRTILDDYLRRVRAARSSPRAFVRCHQHAFHALGGVARECWFDFVPGNKIELLCRSPFCSLRPRIGHRYWRWTFWRAHNDYSERSHFINSSSFCHRGVCAGCFGTRDGRQAGGYGGLLCAQGNFSIAMCSIQADVSQPPSNHVHINAFFKEPDGQGVSENMGGNSAALRARGCGA